MSIILYILLAILILLFMITIHELGHYTAGKILRFKINEFAIGFGPALYKRTSKKTGEVFSIRAFPLGGYCAFEGEEAGSESASEGAFSKQAPWKRLIVLFSGAFFNFLTAIVFSFVLLISVGYDIPKVYSVSDVSQIANVRVYDETAGDYLDKILNSETNAEEKVTFIGSDKIVKITATIDENGMPKDVVVYEHEEKEEYFNVSQITAVISAYAQDYDELKDLDYLENCYVDVLSGSKTANYKFTTFLESNEDVLQKGDVIYNVNGKKVNVLNQLTTLLNNEAKLGKEQATLTIKRNNVKQDIVVDIIKSGYEGNYSYLVGINTEPYVHTFGEAVARAVPLTFEFSWLVLTTLFQLITGQVPMEAVGGTVTTIVVMADYAQKSLKTILVLIPLIAANLAVFNWLPFPALDGAHMLFTGIEWIRKKPINPRVENMIHSLGLWVLLGFVVFADVYQLILRLISWQNI